MGRRGPVRRKTRPKGTRKSFTFKEKKNIIDMHLDGKSLDDIHKVFPTRVKSSICTVCHPKHIQKITDAVARGVGPMVDRVHQILPLSFSPVTRRSYSLVSPPTDFFLNETVDSMQEPPSEEFLNETVEFTHSPSVIVGSHTPDLHQSQQDFTHNEESGELSMGVMSLSLESEQSTGSTYFRAKSAEELANSPSKVKQILPLPKKSKTQYNRKYDSSTDEEESYESTALIQSSGSELSLDVLDKSESDPELVLNMDDHIEL